MYRRILLAAFLLTAACVAPMARTSVIHEGFGVEAALGPTVFQGPGYFDDTTGGQHERTADLTIRTYLGLAGYGRFGFGFSQHIGLDLTLGLEQGIAIDGSERSSGWYMFRPEVKVRPWQTNDLFSVGSDLAVGLMEASWTKGFPVRGRERVSLTLGLANIYPWAGTYSGEMTLLDWVPKFLTPAFTWNFYPGRFRVSPSASASLGWDWATMRPWTYTVHAGVICGTY